jgi:hypothetical protein
VGAEIEIEIETKTIAAPETTMAEFLSLAGLLPYYFLHTCTSSDPENKERALGRSLRMMSCILGVEKLHS